MASSKLYCKIKRIKRKALRCSSSIDMDNGGHCRVTTLLFMSLEVEIATWKF